MSTSAPSLPTGQVIEHPARRAVLLSLVSVLAGLAVALGYLGAQARSYSLAKDRATVTTPGRVVADGIGDTDDIIVRWTDGRGETHEQQFGVYDTERYREGAAFPVRYDPGEPSGVAYPADPDEDVQFDDYFGGMTVALIAGVLLMGGWAFRWMWWRRALGRGSQSMSARMLVGSDHFFRDSSWVELSVTSPGSEERIERWQRVMWHPRLDIISDSLQVQVHGDISSRRRLGITLPDGTDLIPIGWLRHSRPADLLMREDSRDDVADAIILPAGAVLRSSTNRWWPVTRYAGMGAAFGVVVSMFAGDASIWSILVPALTATVFVHLWAFDGANPHG